MAEEAKVEVIESEFVEEVEDNPLSELEQLRQIVFGAARNDLEQSLAELHSEMQSGFEQISRQLQQNISEIQAALEDSVNQLDDRIAIVDSQHEEKSAELNAYADKLSSDIEMTDANANQQYHELQKRLEAEVQQLTDTFTRQHDQTIELLNQVKRELNSSKTDRKTLAGLLATMANNLETDEAS